jgi:feruloyl esterase
MRFVGGALCTLVLATLVPLQILEASPSCETLSTLHLPNTTITMAQAVEAGGFTPPNARNDGRAPRNRAAFCRVAATLKPTKDSDIKIEVWMPAAGWNGKYQAVGNGAFNGTIAYPAMLTALARGYATSSTDTGHEGGSAGFALGHPEKVIDFGWRAVHEMTLASKKIVAAYYETSPKFSYWNGCSAGGRQAMKEAQRFPADFDGIIAGAPGLDWSGRAVQAVRVAQALERNDAARLSEMQTQLLHQAVVQSCDAADGVKDGLIENPARCTFDPAQLKCKGSDAAGCLTPAQIEAASLLYSPAVNPKTKREIAGLARGSELGWTDLGWSSSARATGLDQFRYIVFGDANWTIQKFNLSADVSSPSSIAAAS